MPRIRSVHPDALKSRKLAAAGLAAEACYWRLQTVCDDEGRCEDDPRLLWHTLFPQHDDVTAETVDGFLAALADAGLIVRYESGGVRYLAVTRFEDYQHPQKPKPSGIPSPPDTATEDVQGDNGTAAQVVGDADDTGPVPVRDAYGTGTVQVSPGEGVGEGSSGASAPKKRRDELFDSLTAVFGPATTPQRRSFYGKTVTALLETPGATPAEVVRRGKALLAKRWDDAGPGALLKHWDALKAKPDRRPRAGGIPVDA